MNWQPHIVVDPAVLSGKAVVKGTRLAVELRWVTREQVLACAQERLSDERVFAVAK